MGALTHNGDVITGLPSTASQINYDNTSSGMAATQVQAAVDELNSNKQPKIDNNLQTTSKETTGAINELKSGLTSVDNNLSRRYFYSERHGLTKNGGTATIDISDMNHERAYLVMCAGQYNPLWRYAGLLCITNGNNGYIYDIESDTTLSVTVSGSTLTLTNNNEDNNQIVQVTIIG